MPALPPLPQIMYLRHGRAELDAKLEEVFGTSDLNSGKTLSLTEFLSCLHQHQVRITLPCSACRNGHMHSLCTAVHPCSGTAYCEQPSCVTPGRVLQSNEVACGA